MKKTRSFNCGVLGFWGFGVLEKHSIIIKMKYTRKRKPRTKKSYRKKTFRKKRNITNKLRYTKQKFTNVIIVDGQNTRTGQVLKFSWFRNEGGAKEFNVY
mgnify:CR=1 FL=1